MPLMTPAEALATCEQALRSLITTVLTKKLGQDWISQVLPATKLERIRETRDVEIGRRTRRGVATAPTSELAYTQFYEIPKLIRQHWDDFQPALGDRSETLGLLSRFEALRNSVAHSRELLPFEEDLLSGIAGEIRNKVTIYMSSQDSAGDYFARIDSVTDSFGNCIDGFPKDPTGARVMRWTGLVLRPGDTVTFRCRGTDPQGRELAWWIQIQGHTEFSRCSGRDAELTWHVTADDVAARVLAAIYMASTGPFHRAKGYPDFDYCASSWRPPSDNTPASLERGRSQPWSPHSPGK